MDCFRSGLSADIIARVAKATKSKSRVLETKGKERETRRLTSITFSSLFFAISCMLKGPLTCKFSAKV